MKLCITLAVLVGMAVAQLTPLVTAPIELVRHWTGREQTYKIQFHKGAGWQVQIAVVCNFVNGVCATAWVENPETGFKEYFTNSIQYFPGDGTQEQWLTLFQDFNSTGSTIHVVGSDACVSNCQWYSTLILWIRGGKHPANEKGLQ